MGFIRRSTIALLAIAAATLVHAQGATAPLALANDIVEPLSCLQPVDGLTWMRWSDTSQRLDLWCLSVGRPVLESRVPAAADITGMRILSWNVNVGAGRLETLLPRLLDEAAADGLGLTILLQETFRAGDAVPDVYPAALSEREDRGNAILSTEPLVDVRALELPFGKQRRVAVTALIAPPGIAGGPVLLDRSAPRAIRVVSTHFDTNGDRAAQATALSERLTTFTDAPLFVGGDLNSRGGADDNAVRALANRIPMASCGTGRTNRWPLRLDVLIPIGRLDYIFAGVGDLVRSCETLRDAYDSDHLPLLMTLRY